MRRFNPIWFKEYGSWLEYSIEKDATYCLYCYLFTQDIGMQSGSDSFVTKGFNSWNKKGKLDLYVGAFHGHDEFDNSSDKGNFLDLLQFLANHNDVINEVLQKTPKTNKLTYPDIQKDIVNATTHKTTNAIIEDLDSGFFSILVDESSSALSLKAAIGFLFCKYELSLPRLRGQGYDGDNNMQAIANKHTDIAKFLSFVSKIVTIVGVSCKKREFLQNAQLAKIQEALNLGELESGQDLNQETSLKHAVDVLEMIQKDSLFSEQRVEAQSILSKHDIPILNMDEIFVVGVRPRRNAPQITNLHHYRVDLFFEVIDLKLQELNNHFPKATTKLLLCMACLNPSDSFLAFDIKKLTCLANFYPSDFSETDVLALDNQLQTYIVDIRSNDEFLELKGIGELARKMVETNKNVIYPLVYFLVKLVLTLLVVTTTMKYIKNELHNRMGDQ
ncbi:uncharacterized protein LOC115964284 [Quercus lobata]|uniref:uncharacterized protein LOC115964284 n=1 Tax=Quercus lobata TaxID=97700 RepID=UPI0012463D42|nr:uncharacterized protein LOC115964284 [Quercus lobata]